jgi:hypothetical protein
LTVKGAAVEFFRLHPQLRAYVLPRFDERKITTINRGDVTGNVKKGEGLTQASTPATPILAQQTDWKSTVMPILEHFVDRTPGSFVEEKKHGLVWHYRMAEPELSG